MTVSKDLFLSILSMDAYNRGYVPGLDGLSDATDGTVKIGTATVKYNLQDAGIDSAAQAASFYAVAYQTADGIVISYRGRGDIPAAMQTGGTTGAGLLRSLARRAARSALPAEH
ncbi:MAG: hypothetical protein WBH04_08790 [Albidovulum sp.]